MRKKGSDRAGAPATASVWSAPGMPALVAMTFLGFAGYAVLLPVAPLWAVHGGAGTGVAGLVNGVLLLFTILTQLFVPPALHRFGWGPVLVVGMVLLGLPAVSYVLSDAAVPILALSAVRGVGFGVLTVTGSAAVARLVEPTRRGEAIGAYGLAIALPNLVLLPLGPWIAENVGFWVIFAISGLPLLGVAPAVRLARTIEAHVPELLGSGPEPSAAVRETESTGEAYRRLIRPMVLLLSVTLAGGAVITFSPQMVDRALVASLGLFVMGLVAALSRWRAGVIADRHGAERFLWPLVLVTAAGTAMIAWSIVPAAAVSLWWFLAGMVLLGLAYGALQNLTLVMAFDAVSDQHHNLASAVWNVGFDAGTGVGAVVVGALAVYTSFSVALLFGVVVSLAVLPVAVVRTRTPRRS